eukprot:g23961.t2
MMMSSAFSAMNSSEMDHSPTDGFGRIEMPVPTEVPSPTSPADGLEGATVTATALPVTETVSQARSMHPTEIPEADFSVGVVRGGGGQACFESSSAPHTPTEMPVPTEVSPTTIGEEDEEPTATVPTAIPEPTIPTLPQPEAEADVSGPLASAGYSSAPLPSPEESSGGWMAQRAQAAPAAAFEAWSLQERFFKAFGTLDGRHLLRQQVLQATSKEPRLAFFTLWAVLPFVHFNFGTPEH